MLRTCPNCGGLFATGQSEMFGGKPCQCGYAQTFDLSSDELREQIQQRSQQLATAIAERDAAIAKTYLEGYRELGRQTAEALDQRDDANAERDVLKTEQERLNSSLIDILCKGTEETRFNSVAEMQASFLYKSNRENLNKIQSLSTLCAELVEALKASHNKMAENCEIYFKEEVGQAGTLPTDLGEDYQESEMFEANLKALAHYAELLKKKELGAERDTNK